MDGRVRGEGKRKGGKEGHFAKKEKAGFKGYSIALSTCSS
jgi:hypothetical protein